MDNVDYTHWKERAVLAQCLDSLNLPKHADKVQRTKNPLQPYIDFTIKVAKILKREDILEQLHFAGLIY